MWRTRTLVFGVVGAALLFPSLAHGQVVSQADLVGVWRHHDLMSVDWDASKGVIARPAERTLTLRSDGTYMTKGSYVAESGETKPSQWGVGNSGSKGQWSLKGDTLSVQYLANDTLEIKELKNQHTDPATGQIVGDTVWGKRRPTVPSQFLVSRNGVKLSLALLSSTSKAPVGEPDEFEQVDTTKSAPALVLPPLTLNRADLTGVWVMKNDTLALRADSTWRASGETNAGKWYLAPGNVLMLVDGDQKVVPGTAQRLRLSGVKLQGQQLLGTWASEYAYDRVSATAP